MSEDEQKNPPDGGHILDKEKTAQELSDEKNAGLQEAAVKSEAEKTAGGQATLATLFEDIEDMAKKLAQTIEAIPAGVQHGWHGVAAQINARVKR